MANLNAHPEVEVPQIELGLPLKCYLFVLVFLAPMDYVRPTALVLREIGARPAIILMALGSCWIFARRWRYLLLLAPARWVSILRLFLWIGFLGTLAFLVNVFMGISYTDGKRAPLEQFIGQATLYFLTPFLLVSHAELFRRRGTVRFLMEQIPLVLLCHLAVVGMEAVGVLDPLKLPLNQFRPLATVAGRRPSGLLTEPSYIGVLVGVYGPISLLLHSLSRHRRFIAYAACVWGLLTCLSLGAKTIVPVAGASAIGFILQRRVSWKSPVVLLSFGAVVGLALYNILTYSALDVQENLSSAMRLGSAMLAWNVAKSGYGVLGVGFGQFHFLYNVRYAPWYLNYSVEAKELFSHFANTRASTYDLFLRYLVETGIIGLGLFLLILFRLVRDSRRSQDECMTFGAVYMFGSLGFLITQDPYCFPMFVIGAAILMSVRLPGETDVVSA